MPKKRRIPDIIVALLVVVTATLYAYQNRYYLRYIPLPLSMVEVANTHDALTPAYQTATPLGDAGIPKHDLRQENGLRATLNAIQTMSPNYPIKGFPSHSEMTFSSWLNKLKSTPFYCTDATCPAPL